MASHSAEIRNKDIHDITRSKMDQKEKRSMARSCKQDDNRLAKSRQRIKGITWTVSKTSVRKSDTDIIGKQVDKIQEEEGEQIAPSRLISRLIHYVSARVVLMHNTHAH